jgi:hypothetical protein
MAKVIGVSQQRFLRACIHRLARDDFIAAVPSSSKRSSSPAKEAPPAKAAKVKAAPALPASVDYGAGPLSCHSSKTRVRG